MTKIIRITAKKNGFRRGGIAHPSEPTDYPADKFKKKELDALKAEPMLVVQELDIKQEKEEKPAGEDKKSEDSNKDNKGSGKK